MPINTAYKADRDKILLLAMEMSSLAARSFGLSDEEIGKQCPQLDTEFINMITTWVDKNV